MKNLEEAPKERPAISAKGGLPTMGLEGFMASKQLLPASRGRILHYMMVNDMEAHTNLTFAEWEELILKIK